MDKNRALAALSALAQPTRLDVFRLLVRADRQGMAAGAIAAELGVRQNTLSTNLSLLQAAGLVSGRREGRSIMYASDMEGMRALLAFLMEDCCQGRPELCRPVLDELACKE